MHDRRAQLLGQGDHLGTCLRATGAAQHRHLGRSIEDVGGTPQFGRIGVDRRPRWRGPGRQACLQRLERGVAGHHHHRDATARDRNADRAIEDLRQLLGLRHQLDVVTAFLEQDFRVGGLEVVDADLAAGDVRGDRQHRRAAAMAVEQAIDQVQVARTAAAGAYRQLATQLRLRASGEGGGFLMAHVYPSDAVAFAQRVGEAVQRISDDTVDALHASDLQDLGQILRGVAGHLTLLDGGQAGQLRTAMVTAESCLRMSRRHGATGKAWPLAKTA